MTSDEAGERADQKWKRSREACAAAEARQNASSAPHDELFRDQGIDSTGVNELCAVAEVLKRTLYLHFTGGKDELVAEHLRRFDPEASCRRCSTAPTSHPANGCSPRSTSTRRCARSSQQPWRSTTRTTPHACCARDYKQSLAARLGETAREAGATEPEQLGEQLALLLDGA